MILYEKIKSTTQNNNIVLIITIFNINSFEQFCVFS